MVVSKVVVSTGCCATRIPWCSWCEGGGLESLGTGLSPRLGFGSVEVSSLQVDGRNVNEVSLLLE